VSTNKLVKNEYPLVGIIFIALFLILKIAFYRETFLVSFMLSISLFWNFVLPGFFIFEIYKDKLPFFERLVFGSILGVVIVTTLSYYLGLAGFHVNYHAYTLPPAIIILGLIAGYFAKKNKTKKKQ